MYIGVLEVRFLSFKNKTTLNIVNVSYSFTQFSTLAKIYTTTAREPSIYLTLEKSFFKQIFFSYIEH